MDIIGDQGGNSAGVYAVIRSWKRHSTDGILGVSWGELFTSGTDELEVAAAVETGGDKQDEVKETLTDTKVQRVKKTTF